MASAELAGGSSPQHAAAAEGRLAGEGGAAGGVQDSPVATSEDLLAAVRAMQRGFPSATREPAGTVEEVCVRADGPTRRARVAEGARHTRTKPEGSTPRSSSSSSRRSRSGSGPPSSGFAPRTSHSTSRKKATCLVRSTRAPSCVGAARVGRSFDSLAESPTSSSTCSAAPQHKSYRKRISIAYRRNIASAEASEGTARAWPFRADLVCMDCVRRPATRGYRSVTGALRPALEKDPAALEYDEGPFVWGWRRGAGLSAEQASSFFTFVPLDLQGLAPHLPDGAAGGHGDPSARLERPRGVDGAQAARPASHPSPPSDPDGLRRGRRGARDASEHPPQLLPFERHRPRPYVDGWLVGWLVHWSVGPIDCTSCELAPPPHPSPSLVCFATRSLFLRLAPSVPLSQFLLLSRAVASMPWLTPPA